MLLRSTERGTRWLNSLNKQTLCVLSIGEHIVLFRAGCTRYLVYKHLADIFVHGGIPPSRVSYYLSILAVSFGYKRTSVGRFIRI